MKISCSIACVLLALLVSTARGGVFFTSQYGGADEFAAQSQFNPGFRLFGRLSDGSTRFASGFLDDRWNGVTSAHFFKELGGRTFTELHASWGLDGNNYTQRINIANYVLNPGYVDGQFANPFDTAVLHLASPLDAIAPAMRYRGMQSSIGLLGEGAGYGVSYLVESGEQLDDALYRGGNTQVRYDGPFRGYHANYDLGHFRSSVFGVPMQRAIYFGDSGSMLGRMIDGQWQVTHIMGFLDGLGVGQYSGLLEMGPQNVWIDSARQVPAPGSAALVILAATCLVRSRKRR